MVRPRLVAATQFGKLNNMAVFEITAPNGKKYEIEGETQEGALAALQSHLGPSEPAARQAATAQPEMNVIATTADGGRIYQMPDGSHGFTSAGFATTDPAKVAKLMEGASPIELVQSDLDNQRIDANPIAARAQEVVRGTPFIGSYADDAVGLVSPQAADNMRATSQAMQRERPKETMALNLGGAVAGSIPLALAAGPSIAANAATNIGGRAGQAFALGSVVGGSEGAIYGAGEQEGGRGRNAAVGGGIGAAAGGVLGVVAPYASAGFRNLITKLRGSDVKVIARELRVSPQAAGVIRDTLQTGSEADAIAAIQRAGPDAMLADAGKSASTLLDAAAASGGNASQIAQPAVSARAQAATGKIVSVLDRTLGAPKGEQELITAVRTGSAPARSAAYDAAYAAPIDYASGAGRRIEGLMSRVPASAWRRASQLMELDGDVSMQKLFSVRDNGSVAFQAMPDVRQLDYITRALNDVAAEADGAGKLGGTTDLGRSTGNLSLSIRQTMRAAVPEYGTALDTAAGAISERNAIETGYTLLNKSTRREDIAQAMGGASRAEREAAKQGVRASIDDAMANVTRTMADPDTTTREGIIALRDMSSRSNTTKLRILLGQDAANELLSEVDQAATAFELRAAIAENSKTAIRTSVQRGVENRAEGGVLSAIQSGEPVNAAKRIIQALTGETSEAVELRRMGIYEDIATALTQTRGARAQNALLRINAAMNGQAVSEQSARFIANTLTTTGVLAGGRGVNSSLALQ